MSSSLRNITAAAFGVVGQVRIVGVVNAGAPGDESVTFHDPLLLEEIRAGVHQADPPELDDEAAWSA